MRESVPIARYSPACNVLRQWKTLLILTYRVYRLYDIYIYVYIYIYIYIYIYKTKKHLEIEQRSNDAAVKKRPNTSGVGKNNYYYEDIYIHVRPYNNTE